MPKHYCERSAGLVHPERRICCPPLPIRRSSLMRLGVAGVGVVGGAVCEWLEQFTKHHVMRRDPAKGLADTFKECQAVFVCVPAPPTKSRNVDLKSVEAVLSYLGQECSEKMPVFIKTTVPPGSCDMLTEKFSRPIFSMPEFLTERVAMDDFKAQPVLTGAHIGYKAFLRAV